MTLARERSTVRKLDTRRKIELGGLVIKAGLEQEDRATVLGVLMEAAERLKAPDAETMRAGWKQVGSALLTRDGNNN